MTKCLLSFTVICYACLPADTEVVHLLLLLTCSPGVDFFQGGFHIPATRRHQGDLTEPLNSLLWQNAGSLTSDLSHSTLQQGRPLREQQEVAAAVIQRCYKKYKQVGPSGASKPP